MTGLLLSLHPRSKTNIKKEALFNSLAQVGEWKGGRQSAMSAEIVESLKLDDYLFRNYTNGQESVSMYIGYYLSAEKIGAAHDPLVCFPGQGLALSDKATGVITVMGGHSEHRVNYSSFIATEGLEKQYVLYWFQAYNATSSSTFVQKIFLLASKLRGGGQDNAFVRITLPMNSRSASECKEIITSFVRDFYPVFLSYIEGKNG